MMTVKQVSLQTGVSVRALQFYDEIGLLKPTQVTQAGYRLYDDSALEVLQQILFFKELDFTLKEIKAIMENPQFDKTAAFKKQRELIEIKRDRLNSLLGLLDRLIKGEKCMEFKDFDLNGYFKNLEDFKETHADEIVERFGSMDSFEKMVSDLKMNESEIAGMAAKQYGSVEKYAESTKKSLESFLANGPLIEQDEVGGLVQRTEEITKRLTADLSRDPASQEVQKIVEEMVSFTEECSRGIDMGENYWSVMAENYLASPVYAEATDKKYGKGASEFIGRALNAYIHKN